MTMADRSGLKFVGFIFATVTVTVMLATGMVVKGYADGAYSLDTAPGAAQNVTRSLTLPRSVSGSRPGPATTTASDQQSDKSDHDGAHPRRRVPQRYGLGIVRPDGLHETIIPRKGRGGMTPALVAARARQVQRILPSANKTAALPPEGGKAAAIEDGSLLEDEG